MQDPLNVSVPLTGVDSSLPLLPEADYIVQCTESSVEPNKDKTGLNWNLKLATTTPVTSADGSREIKPNFPVFMTLALQPREDSKDTEAFKRNLAEAVDALFGTDKTSRPDFNRDLVNQAVGKTCTAHVYIDEWQGKQNNKVKRLRKAA
jgi:hypothetical protein